jgi:hypothetical protein
MFFFITLTDVQLNKYLRNVHFVPQKKIARMLSSSISCSHYVERVRKKQFSVLYW